MKTNISRRQRSSPGIINPSATLFHSQVVLKAPDHSMSVLCLFRMSDSSPTAAGTRAAHSGRSLYSRIVTGFECNPIRLCLWLAYRVYRPFKVFGVCRLGHRPVLKFSRAVRAAEAANIEYIARNTTIPDFQFHGYKISLSSMR
jgi:hypothetical protein